MDIKNFTAILSPSKTLDNDAYHMLTNCTLKLSEQGYSVAVNYITEDKDNRNIQNMIMVKK